MSDPIKPTPSPTPQTSGNKGQVLPIQSLPDGLQNVSRALRLQGEVVQQNSDGSTRIKTPEGNIDVTIRGRQPQPGAKVEVDVPAGSPPRTVTVRPAPATPAAPPSSQQPTAPPTTTQPPAQAPIQTVPLPTTKPAQGQIPVPTTPTQTQTPTPATPNAPSSPSGTTTTSPVTTAPTATTPQSTPPVSTTLPPDPAQAFPTQAAAKPLPAPLPSSYQPPPTGAPAPAAQLPPLSTGQLVRLTPLPAALAQTQFQQTGLTPESIVAGQISRTSFIADLIARGGTDNLQTSLIQTIKSLNAPIPQTPILTGTPQTGTPLPQVAITTPTATSLPVSLPDLEVGTTQSLQTSLSGAVGTDDIIQDNHVSPRLFQLDVKVLDIKPAGVQITPLATPDEKGLPLRTPLEAFLKEPNTGTILPEARPASLTGIVTGFTPARLPIVTIQWPTGALSQNFVLQFAAGNLKPGDQILFQPQPQTGQASAAANALTKLPLMEASTVWPVLDEMFQTLSQSAPQMAQMMARIIPSPSNAAQMGPAALLFVAAIRSGDISGWLNDRKIDALTKIGKDSLISRLSSDMGNALRSNADALDSDWKSYPLPLLWQNEISKVLLHVKHENDPQDRENKDGSTRFIMDLSLTRMGQVQLDGLLRGKRLDLVVRTELPISGSMQDAMQTAYAKALDGTDIFGELGFQGDLNHQVHVLKREETIAASI